jgi:hypothetical protein
VNIAAGGSQPEIELVGTKNLANQLANAEWLTSLPGPDDLKSNTTGCVAIAHLAARQMDHLRHQLRSAADR